MGAITCAFGAVSGGQVEIEDPKAQEFLESFDGAASTFASIILAGGVLCLLTGILGVLTARMKNPFFAAPFIGLCFIIGLLLLIGAAMALSALNPAAAALVEEEMCAAVEQEYGVQFKDAYGVAVDSVMCTAACPCKKGSEAAWEALTAEQLAEYKRKPIINDLAAASAEPVTEPLSLLFLDPATNEGVATYDTWAACYEELQKAEAH